MARFTMPVHWYMAAGEAVNKDIRRIVVVDREAAEHEGVRVIVTPYDFVAAALG